MQSIYARDYISETFVEFTGIGTGVRTPVVKKG